jgi:heat shock protein HtpX
MFGNYLKTSILMAAIVALFGTVGAALGGGTGMIMALLLAAGMNIYAYWFSDKAVLKMYGAQEITPDNMQFRNYYNMVKELAQNAELPMPKVYVMENPQPNAFATGRNPENYRHYASVKRARIARRHGARASACEASRYAHLHHFCHHGRCYWLYCAIWHDVWRRPQ